MCTRVRSNFVNLQISSTVIKISEKERAERKEKERAERKKGGESEKAERSERRSSRPVRPTSAKGERRRPPPVPENGV